MFYTYILRRDGVPFYVGKGKGKRYLFHVQCAKRNDCVHYSCKAIQEAWQQGQTISHEIIQSNMTDNEAFAHEIELIAYGRDQGWPLVNATPGGNGCKGYAWGPEQRQNLSKAMTLYWSDDANREKYRTREIPIEQVENMHQANNGNNHHSIVHKGFIAPDGTIYQDIFNLAQFCRNHNLSNAHMLQVEREQRSHHQGWKKFPLVPFDEAAAQERRSAVNRGTVHHARTHLGFISPNGTIYKDIFNLAQFCRDHQLSSAHMLNVESGSRRQHKGWTMYIP